VILKQKNQPVGRVSFLLSPKEGKRFQTMLQNIQVAAMMRGMRMCFLRGIGVFPMRTVAP
jgi:hypothetical protein